jgi:3-phenylpropionate/trans-cinnamate dioxygenase ferredoxin reductase subunit
VVALRADGEHAECDAVIVCPPSVPHVGLAAAAGVRVGDGVLVDARLRSSDPHVLAAGDVAQVYVYGVGRMRIPHAPAAVEQGRVAGRSLVRRDALLDPLPVVTSEQFDVALELYGHPSPPDEVLLRGDPEDGRFCAFWVRSELVTAALSFDVRGVGEALERIVRSGTRVDRRRLVDPGRPLGELAPWPVARQSSLVDTA